MAAMHFTEYDTRVAGYALIVDDADRVLLTWWNGEGRAAPGWSLPGGGIDYGESFEAGVLREVREEAGYDVALGPVMLTDILFGTPGATTGRPFRSVRLVFDATITGGVLGTTEVGGSTDYAAWLPLAEVAEQPSRAGILDLALEARRRRLDTTDTTPTTDTTDGTDGTDGIDGIDGIDGTATTGGPTPGHR